MKFVDKMWSRNKLLELIRVPGVTKKETPIAEKIRSELHALGVPETDIIMDNAHTQCGKGMTCGNLIIKIPGTVDGPRTLLAAHMDVMPGGDGVHPLVDEKGSTEGVVYQEGAGVLGGDDRNGVTVILSAIRMLKKMDLSHPPLTLLFSSGEESGILGAHHVDVEALGGPSMALSFDGDRPDRVVIGAPGAIEYSIHINGRSAHAGKDPEKGVSAVVLASMAIAELDSRGYHGKIVKGERLGSANLGIIQGGDALNKVMESILIRGEARSYNKAFLHEIVEEIETVFRKTVDAITSKDGKHRGAIQAFSKEEQYGVFKLNENSSEVQRVVKASEKTGLKPKCINGLGGLDASWLNAHGIPTVTLGTGNSNMHSPEETVDLGLFYKACEAAVYYILDTE
jgi:tripeptide aminopeptidase